MGSTTRAAAELRRLHHGPDASNTRSASSQTWHRGKRVNSVAQQFVNGPAEMVTPPLTRDKGGGERFFPPSVALIYNLPT
uniref:Uncharacterized protein n=1 Tax=Knipowitschia caucasica TaxID=637954 RepID=A0AAV2K0T5_KNICA